MSPIAGVDLVRGAMRDFDKLLAQIEAEARAEGPDAVRELRALQAKYAKQGARGEPRTQLMVRLSISGLARIDEFAEREGRSRSDVIRRLLAEAIQHRDAAGRKAKGSA